jgi:hypothetical protein
MTKIKEKDSYDFYMMDDTISKNIFELNLCFKDIIADEILFSKTFQRFLKSSYATYMFFYLHICFSRKTALNYPATPFGFFENIRNIDKHHNFYYTKVIFVFEKVPQSSLINNVGPGQKELKYHSGQPNNYFNPSLNKLKEHFENYRGNPVNSVFDYTLGSMRKKDIHFINDQPFITSINQRQDQGNIFDHYTETLLECYDELGIGMVFVFETKKLEKKYKHRVNLRYNVYLCMEDYAHKNSSLFEDINKELVINGIEEIKWREYSMN